MHAEWCEMSPTAASQIRQTKAGEGNVIAVGTTAVRTLESLHACMTAHGEGHDMGHDAQHPTAQKDDTPSQGHALETRLLIAPGHEWKIVDGMLTNFHLPRSTLLALVAASLDGGIDRVRELYALAITERYRFYSYGDAMLILP